MKKHGNIYYPEKIDLHIHSTVSDGTDTPEQILEKVRKAGIELFSITDHDAVTAGPVIQELRREGDPLFITGVEFSCKDSEGKYHILGYGFDPRADAIRTIVEQGHSYRMDKVHARLDFLKEAYGFDFSEQDRDRLLALDNPGKPHIGNLMAKYGYAKSKDLAISEYINKCTYKSRYVTPKQAIDGILDSGGIPILAHPPYGNGSDLITGEKLRERVRRLKKTGLQGIEGYYSRYRQELRAELLAMAEEEEDLKDFYITAGSDYHGTNKPVALGETGCRNAAEGPGGLRRFLEKSLLEKV